MRRERAARITKSNGGHPLLTALAEEVADRLLGIKGDFLNVLEIGGLGASVAGRLPHDEQRRVTVCDGVDEETPPFREGMFDLIVSLLSLSFMNHVPRHLSELKRLLRPGGLLMAVTVGGETFSKLRAGFMDAELALRGGAGSRFSPLIDIVTWGELLTRAGFYLPVVDREACALAYPDVYAVVRDLRGMGLTAAHHARAREWIPREAFETADRLCKSCSEEENVSGRLVVKAELFFLHGWRADTARCLASQNGSTMVEMDDAPP